MNAALAESLNPGVSRTDAGIGYGDRAMWTTNDVHLGLSNGTLLMLEPGDGVPGENAEPVRAIAEDGRPLLLPPSGVGSLIPAWAMTVHKSQGLEVPIVVVVLCGEDTHPALLTRAMLYTAITRATRAAIVCADPHARPCARNRRSSSPDSARAAHRRATRSLTMVDLRVVDDGRLASGSCRTGGRAAGCGT